MGDLEAASRAAAKTMNCILGDKPTEVSRTDELRFWASDLNYGDHKIQPAISLQSAIGTVAIRILGRKSHFLMDFRIGI